MAKKSVTVMIGSRTMYQGKDCDVCVKSGVLLVHNGDPLFAYVLKPGEWMNFKQDADGVKVQVDE
jgi:hypothetical protein